MDWMSAKHWPKVAGVVLAALIGVGLATTHWDDPSITNLRTHSEGIKNWLGLPGALMIGSLVEWFGSASLAFPLLVLNFFSSPRNRPSVPTYLLWSLVLVSALSSLHGLWLETAWPNMQGSGIQSSAIQAAGLMGWSMGHWVELTTGPLAGSFLVAVVLMASLNSLAFHPIFRKFLSDFALFSGWAARVGIRTGRTSSRSLLRSTGNAGSGIGRAGSALGSALVGAVTTILGVITSPWRALAGVMTRRRAPSISKVKARKEVGGKTFTPSTALEASPHQASGPLHSNQDPFDSWLAQSSDFDRPDPEEPPSAATKAIAAPPPPSAPHSIDVPSSDLPPLEDSFEQAFHAAFEGTGFEGTAFENTASEQEEPANPTEILEPEAEKQADPSEKTAAAPHREFSESPFDASPELDSVESALDFVDEAYDFEEPEAKAAWRERFQRYARNLDLDWQDQLWGDVATEDGEGTGDEPEEEPTSK